MSISTIAGMIIGLAGGGWLLFAVVRWLSRPRLTAEVYQKEVKRGFFLWRRHDRYRVTQYKYDGVPIGGPVETLVNSDGEVNEDAVRAVAATGALAAGKPELAVLLAPKNAAPPASRPALPPPSAKGKRR